MNFGVLYVAFGGWHQQEAIRSHRSLRFFNPHIKTAIVVENGFSGDFLSEFDVIISVNRGPFHAYTEKVRALQLSPFETTLYLDTDTHIRGDVEHMQDLLGDVALAACMVGNTPTINSGVLLYSRTRCASLLDEWRRRMEPAEQCEMGFFADRHTSYGDQNFLNLILAERGTNDFKTLDYLIYNCKDGDIWAAVERNEIERSIILHTHDWERLYSLLPNVDPRLRYQLDQIQNYTSAIFAKKNEMVAAGNGVGAALLLRRAIDYFPNVHFMVDLAQCTWNIGAIDEAGYWFARAAKAEPNMGYPSARHADFLYAIGRAEQAFTAGRRARKLDPKCQLAFDPDGRQL